MHIARLVASDAPRYRSLMLHAYATAADAFTSTAEERAQESDSWWLSRIANPQGLSQVFGAFHQEELIGTVAIEFTAKPKTKHKAHIIGLFVHEKARGLGAGKALLHKALTAAMARPTIQVVTLIATEGNLPAIRLYETQGFKIFGIEPMGLATPRGLKGIVHMWLPLPRLQAEADTFD